MGWKLHRMGYAWTRRFSQVGTVARGIAGVVMLVYAGRRYIQANRLAVPQEQEEEEAEETIRA